MEYSKQRRNLLSSSVRVQAPWVKVTIGNFTFGVFSRVKEKGKSDNGKYVNYNVQFPNYIQSLNIVKINGQVNQYTLSANYPIRSTDDPNFFEKVLSSVSKSRKIVFSYGDASMPAYVYKEEEAIITDVGQSFNFTGSAIMYNIHAVSSAAIKSATCCQFPSPGVKKPSDEIKRILKNPSYGLQNIFTGMPLADDNRIAKYIAGDDKPVQLESKMNTSALDYISYLVSCMIPAGTPNGQLSPDIYILTIHDDTTLTDQLTSGQNRPDGGNDIENPGPYFRVTKTSYNIEQSDAFELDIGYNTSTIVTDFQIEKAENYAMYYDYQQDITPNDYVQRLNANGEWYSVYADPVMSKNQMFETRPSDISWWTKITKYPINATITVQGLLRPAMLMTYLRLNVIFPGGHKHMSSGLYIVTKQEDTIDSNGYKTKLSLTKISGDNSITT